MGFDFALVLVIAAVVTGVTWAVDAWYFRPERERLAAMGASGQAPASVNEPLLVEYSRSFFPIILLVLLVRSFLYEPFRIPSDSMMPTLLDGDFIFVNKYVYGLRLPVVNTKVLPMGAPERGDVVVFRLPSDPSTNFIKRIVGLPSDKVSFDQKQLLINGQPVARDCSSIFVYPGHENARMCVESLGEIRHKIIHLPHARPRNVRDEFVVPDDHYFVMGDNRDNSKDSRFPEVGFIPETHLVGEAVRIWMNLDWQWNRIGSKIE